MSMEDGRSPTGRDGGPDGPEPAAQSQPSALIPNAAEFAASPPNRRSAILTALQTLITSFSEEVKNEQEIINRKFAMAQWASDEAASAVGHASRTRAMLAGCMSSYIDLCQVIAREAAEALETTLAQGPAQALEARSGETEGLDPKGESAVAASDAP